MFYSEATAFALRGGTTSEHVIKVLESAAQNVEVTPDDWFTGEFADVVPASKRYVWLTQGA
jgi:hypothetical protein